MTPSVTRRTGAIALAVAGLMAAFAAGYALHPAAPEQAATAQQAPRDGNRKVLYWYDPMVPGQRFDQPGKSPFMDMPLTPRYADETPDQGGITIGARQQQNLGVAVAAVQQSTLSQDLDAFGTVNIDERSLRIIPARAGGLVDKLYVRAEQQRVTQNQPLAQLWIPEWSAAQQEYLAIRQLGDRQLTAAARQKLQLLLMPEDVVRAVERSGQPQTRLTLRSPASGFINKLSVREGSQVTAAQPMFELASLDPLWLVADFPQAQASAVAAGDEIIATSARWPGRRFHGRVEELLPLVENSTRTYRARIAIDNHDARLQPWMYMRVQRADGRGQSETVLTVPQDALVQTGSRNTVLLAEGNGYFRPIEVTAGRSLGDRVEIINGLHAGDKVVTAGQFLIDSEASLRGALPQLAGAAAPAESAGGGGTTTPQIYRGDGTLKARHGQRVTLAHGAIAALGWPAMTMDFILLKSGMPPAINTGSRVQFAFTLDDNGAQLTDIAPVRSGQ
ncbi:efflux RND transporter periplasmic adaptor subunit [Candidatus Sodalis endolongispinus]|uniref:Efflux RND transporter periplasmic adaptor subunit n=1 Tax=Candidatus Sodalis endolongispinus TaxID=2812662 RepID=A0ABS5Y8W2_9GAMM|nr:efflux RND transporter periplasmic adaptor subunit [Candidatus Sodalis endolongispinus]MBT9431388.1 efflux RND transporter periplasmic adaptor subunit [Candidatus Sodalis endolongispinus]